MVFHVALLGEPDAAHLTLEGLLSSVFDHVNLQGALLIEGLVALTALKGTFTCMKKETNKKNRPTDHLSFYWCCNVYLYPLDCCCQLNRDAQYFGIESANKCHCSGNYWK